MAKHHVTVTIEVDAASEAGARGRVERIMAALPEHASRGMEWNPVSAVRCDGEPAGGPEGRGWGYFGDPDQLGSPEAVAETAINATPAGAIALAQSLGFHLFASMGAHYFKRGGPSVGVSTEGWSSAYDSTEEAARAAVVRQSMQNRLDDDFGLNLPKLDFLAACDIYVEHDASRRRYYVRRYGSRAGLGAPDGYSRWDLAIVPATEAALAFEQRVREGRHAR